MLGAGHERPAFFAALDRGLKRVLDVVVAASLLVLASPLIAVLAVAVRLESRGPAFYRCRRVGRNGHVLQMLKFRKMRDGASGPALAAPDDARFTRLGSFLARTKLDELPQLWNVLKGEMSLVGPRPEQCFIVDTYNPWQRKRLAVPHGLTGWWQVNGRSDLPMHLNTEYDLYYIQNYSLLLDLRIIWRTLAVVLKGGGAY